MSGCFVVDVFLFVVAVVVLPFSTKVCDDEEVFDVVLSHECCWSLRPFVCCELLCCGVVDDACTEPAVWGDGHDEDDVILESCFGFREFVCCGVFGLDVRLSRKCSIFERTLSKALNLTNEMKIRWEINLTRFWWRHKQAVEISFNRLSNNLFLNSFRRIVNQNFIT